MRWYLCAVVVLVLNVCGSHIHLHHGRIDVQSHPAFLDERHPSQRVRHLSVEERLADAVPHPFLLQVHRNAVKEHGSSSAVLDTLLQGYDDVHVPKGSFIPDHTFLIHASHDTMLKLSKHPHVYWAGNLHPKHKMSEFFHDGCSSDATDSESMRMMADFAPHIDLESRVDAIMRAYRSHRRLSGFDIEVTIGSDHRAQFSVDSSKTLRSFSTFLSHESDVLHLSRSCTIQVRNRWARSIVQNGGDYLFDTELDYTKKTGLMSWDHNLTGHGQVIGVSDTGLDFKNCFFAEEESMSPIEPPFKLWSGDASNNDMSNAVDFQYRKIIQYVSFVDEKDEDGHGTHVMGSAAGSPFDSPDASHVPYSGMAPNAKLAVFDIGDRKSLSTPLHLDTQMLKWSYVAGARIHSASWGTESPGYGPDSRDLDTFIEEHPDMVILVAAGNSGICSDSFFSVGSPATAKNVISVGASENSEKSFEFIRENTASNPHGNGANAAYFSSMGPTSDGRLKPDVMAPGHTIVSARYQRTAATCAQADLGSNLEVLSGTSMATPILAGNVALVREYFMEGFYPTGERTASDRFTPSAALVKNMVINSAAQMTGVKAVAKDQCSSNKSLRLPKRPYYTHGYGLVTLNDTLYFASDVNGRKTHIPTLNQSAPDSFWDTPITQNETHEYSFCAAPSNHPQEIRITLVWTDPVASPYAMKQLVNDLDLTVTTPRETLKGNQGSNLLMNPDEHDRFNNVEAVYLSNPEGREGPLAFNVRVRAHAINVGPHQPYSVVVSGNVAAGACTASPAPAEATPFLSGAQSGLLNVDPLIDEKTCFGTPVLVRTAQVGTFSTLSWVLSKQSGSEIVNGFVNDSYICLENNSSYVLTVSTEEEGYKEGSYSVRVGGAVLYQNTPGSFEHFETMAFSISQFGEAILGVVKSDTCDAGTTLLRMAVFVDDYPLETSWTLTETTSSKTVAVGSYAGSSVCVPEGNYAFTLFDAFGDGIAQTYVLGLLTSESTELISNVFAYDLRVTFNLTASVVGVEQEDADSKGHLLSQCSSDHVSIVLYSIPSNSLYASKFIRYAIKDTSGTVVAEVAWTSNQQEICVPQSSVSDGLTVYNYGGLSTKRLGDIAVFVDGTEVATSTSDDFDFYSVYAARFESGSYVLENKLHDACPTGEYFIGIEISDPLDEDYAWALLDSNDSELVRAGSAGGNYICVPDGEYRVIVWDFFGDGVASQKVFAGTDGTYTILYDGSDDFDFMKVITLNPRLSTVSINHDPIQLKDVASCHDAGLEALSIVVKPNNVNTDMVWTLELDGGSFVYELWGDIVTQYCVEDGNYSISFRGYLGGGSPVESDSFVAIYTNATRLFYTDNDDLSSFVSLDVSVSVSLGDSKLISYDYSIGEGNSKSKSNVLKWAIPLVVIGFGGLLLVYYFNAQSGSKDGYKKNVLRDHDGDSIELPEPNMRDQSYRQYEYADDVPVPEYMRE